MEKIRVAFVCVHNSCRSQMAEAFGKKYLEDCCECYSAGTETKPQINQDAVRIMKKFYGLDMSDQYSKLLADVPEADIYISMGCNVQCPVLPGKQMENWGLEDPTGQGEERFREIAERIQEKVLELRERLYREK
ncbi:MAG: arsenate reductase ArsC [Lachnospiraceae bacterium]|nr:arsenate reductase ArsC [Lachnospiraceae bacterium]